MYKKPNKIIKKNIPHPLINKHMRIFPAPYPLLTKYLIILQMLISTPSPPYQTYGNIPPPLLNKHMRISPPTYQTYEDVDKALLEVNIFVCRDQD